MQISVIICTRNRAHAIISCLDATALAIKNASPVEAEIVIVNNASEDDTVARVEEWAKDCGVTVNLVHEAQKGLSRARNCGLRAAKGNVLVFTDDDCHLDGDYIKDALRHDARDDAPVLRGGRVVLGDKTDLPLTIRLETETRSWHRDWNSARHANLGDTILGCNMVLCRKLIETVGEFDPRLGAGSPTHAAEDIDYVYRTYLAGFKVEYVPDMVVYHFHGRKDIAEGQDLIRKYCIGSGALYAKHMFRNPILCMQFYWDVRDMLRQLFAKEDKFMPDLSFTLKQKVFYNIKGIGTYMRG